MTQADLLPQSSVANHQAANQLSTTSLTVTDYLACLQIVMVNTTLPANIGSAARAMHTMGLSRLTVVEPKLPIDDSSVSHAAGGIGVLEQAQVVSTLPEALKSCQLVFAASSRSRHLPRPVVTPAQAGDIIARFIDAQLAHHSLSQQKTLSSPNINNVNTTPFNNCSPANIAIVFGREDRGLTNEELALADYHIQIQANPDYPVLNVAAAVQVIASFIYAQIQSHVDTLISTQVDSQHDSDSSATNCNDAHNPVNHETPQDSQAPSVEPALTSHHTLEVMVRQVWDEPAITQSQSQQLNERLIELMVQLNLANPDDLRALPQRLSRLSSRLQLDQKEYQLISAVIAKLLKNAG